MENSYERREQQIKNQNLSASTILGKYSCPSIFHEEKSNLTASHRIEQEQSSNYSSRWVHFSSGGNCPSQERLEREGNFLVASPSGMIVSSSDLDSYKANSIGEENLTQMDGSSYRPLRVGEFARVGTDGMVYCIPTGLLGVNIPRNDEDTIPNFMMPKIAAVPQSPLTLRSTETEIQERNSPACSTMPLIAKDTESIDVEKKDEYFSLKNLSDKSKGKKVVTWIAPEEETRSTVLQKKNYDQKDGCRKILRSYCNSAMMPVSYKKRCSLISQDDGYANPHMSLPPMKVTPTKPGELPNSLPTLLPSQRPVKSKKIMDSKSKRTKNRGLIGHASSIMFGGGAMKKLSFGKKVSTKTTNIFATAVNPIDLASEQGKVTCSSLASTNRGIQCLVKEDNERKANSKARNPSIRNLFRQSWSKPEIFGNRMQSIKKKCTKAE